MRWMGARWRHDATVGDESTPPTAAGHGAGGQKVCNRTPAEGHANVLAATNRPKRFTE